MTIKTLCDRWPYLPEQAAQAPIWVLRLTAFLNALDAANAGPIEEMPPGV